MKTFINYSIAALLILTGSLAAQEKVIRFPHQKQDESYSRSFITSINNSNLFFFYIENEKILLSKSTDNGLSWGSPVTVFHLEPSHYLPNVHFKALHDKTGRMYLFISGFKPQFIYSDDNGLSWSLPVFISPTTNFLVPQYDIGYSVLNHEFYLTYSMQVLGIHKIFITRSLDRGLTWSEPVEISINGRNPCITVMSNGGLVIAFDKTSFPLYSVMYILSSNNGLSWSSPKEIFKLDKNFSEPKSIAYNNNIWLFYIVKKGPGLPHKRKSDIEYVKSEDGGITWSERNKFTNFTGNDINHSVSVHNNYPLLSFASERMNSGLNEVFQLYYALPGTLDDSFPPPMVYGYSTSPQLLAPSASVKVTIKADGYIPIEKIMLRMFINNKFTESFEMKDDGSAGDTIAGDSEYTALIETSKNGDVLHFVFAITDHAGYEYSLKSKNYYVGMLTHNINDLMKVNRIEMPFNNRGDLANIEVIYNWGARFDGLVFLFAGGFFLSGYDNSMLWAAGTYSPARTSDFRPGVTGSDPDDVINSIYKVKKSDPPFGDSWQKWRFAVLQGADFYDGNNDGVYDPVDLNGNGKWDPFEDMPPIIGDEIAWCVFNDNLPSLLRRFSDVSSKGITIHQNLFAVSDSLLGPYNKIIFLKYKIINTGTVSQLLDSVFFSINLDPDIGNYLDDLAGFDHQTNSTYSYNNGGDELYGTNPPAVFVTLLQGPHSYIPGVTFIDNNYNGVYDHGVDTALDTAYYKRSLLLDEIDFPGSKNLSVSSSVKPMIFHIHYPTYIDNIYNLRHGHLGYRPNGTYLDPCSYGIVSGNYNCSEINPRYHFAGIPETGDGWIDNMPTDVSTMQSTGPFSLAENEPVEIIYALIVGRGEDYLNSITDARATANFAQQVYNSNFKEISIDKDELFAQLPRSYLLYQNYPNPFNPYTKIDFEVPAAGKVEIKLYDILGREVKTIHDGFHYPGRHTIVFNAGQIASGVYFYRLKAGSFMQTKKMVLLR